MGTNRSNLLFGSLAALAFVTTAHCRTMPDVFNSQPTVVPLERVQLLGVDNLRLVRLVTRESTLAYGDSSLSESYQPDARIGVGQYDLLHFELETAPGRVTHIVHKSHPGILSAFPGTSGGPGGTPTEPDALYQSQTIVYDSRGDPQYYVLASVEKAFVKKANYDERGRRIGRAQKGDGARYTESGGYRIVDGEVWQIETVFVSWGNLMSVHVSGDGNTLRFYRSIRPDPASLMATVRKTGTIENWVDHLERSHFRGTAVHKAAYLGNQVAVTNGEVTWHRDPGEELLLNRQLSPESFILFSVMMLGQPWVTRMEEGRDDDPRRLPFVYTLGGFEVRVGCD